MQNLINATNWHSHIISFINTKTNPYKEMELFLEQAQEAIYQLPYHELKPLLDFKNGGNAAGYVLLQGLKTDPNLIPTCESAEEIYSKKETFYSEFWLALIAKILGEPIGYAQERNGEIFQNVRPRKGQETKIASDSSSIILDLHVENGYHPIRPDFLMLYALRSDPQQKGYTLVVEIKEILSLFSAEEINVLRGHNFKTSVDWNFGNFNAERGTGPTVSILFGAPENPMIFYDDEYVIGTTPNAQKILEKLRQILHAEMQSILLKPGEMLVIDNYKSVHGRTSFQAQYNGNDRWLQRLLVVRDLNMNQKILKKSGRIFDWQYVPDANYNQIIY